jgi:transcription elongation GreA/GreB family factor
MGMSRLELTQKRLTQALESLEKAAELAARRGKAASAAEARAASLNGERERLLARIAELEDELAALSSVTQEVEGRLDGAIGEIRAALAR